jgi:hypothetical protein
MPLAAAGFGVAVTAVTRLLDRGAMHQAAFLHVELIVAQITLGHGTARLLQIDLVQAVAGEVNSVQIFPLTRWKVLATKKPMD